MMLQLFAGSLSGEAAMSKNTNYKTAQLPRYLALIFRDSKCVSLNTLINIEATMKHFIRHTAALAVALATIGCMLAPQWTHADTHMLQAEQPQPSVVRGRVWDDANHDGVRQQSERGYAGITVTLYVGRVQVVTTTLTSAAGDYELANLEALSYTLGFALPKDYSFTLRGAKDATSSTDSNVYANGLTDELAIGAGNEVVNIDAGIWRSALVSEEPPTTQMKSVFLPLISNGR
jgi:SdrD B-like domain